MTARCSGVLPGGKARGREGKGGEGREECKRLHTDKSCALECTSHFPISKSSCHAPHAAPLTALKLTEQCKTHVRQQDNKGANTGG